VYVVWIVWALSGIDSRVVYDLAVRKGCEGCHLLFLNFFVRLIRIYWGVGGGLSANASRNSGSSMCTYVWSSLVGVLSTEEGAGL
jgi:hypothetical protein